MTKTSKIALSVIMAGAVVLSAKANTINGGISFNGNVTPYLSADGTGAKAADYISAHSVVFGPSVVSLGANGTFSAVPANTPVTMYSPLVINPPALPIPATSPLWQVTVGATTYSFTLSSLTEPVDQATFMTLTGSGIMSDGTPADSNTGTWVATFTSSGSTFSWNASAAANTPEAGTTLALMGMGLSALGAFARLRKQS